MGIKQLNLFLKQNCRNSISNIYFKDLSNKKIAIDISIYLYKFLEEDALIDNLYLMIGLFRKYNILPVFVFDGKPPKEKYAIIEERRDKKKAEKKYYNKLNERLLELKKGTGLKNQEDIYKIQMIMREEYKKTIRISQENIKETKQLIKAYGACYLHAEGEADVLCAELVKNKKVYGCLSEDMDMFVYGCNRIFRGINIYNETLQYYDYVKVLKELKMSSKEFREMCVYAGTDYNRGINIFNTFKLFKLFKRSKEMEFYDWLVKQNYIEDTIKLYETYFMFDIIENKRKIKLEWGDKNKSILNSILKKEGFIVIE